MKYESQWGVIGTRRQVAKWFAEQTAKAETAKPDRRRRRRKGEPR